MRSRAQGCARRETECLDSLVEMELPRRLLDHVALWQDLEDCLERKLDVVSKRALDWHVRTRVLTEAVPQ